MKNLQVTETKNLSGKKVTLHGRAETIRDHGKVTFIDLADFSGIVQTVTREKFDISPQDVLEIKGLVKKRPDNLINKEIETGQVEVEIKSLKIISKAKTPPIPTDGDGSDIEEDLRLKYRYLDLRRKRLQKNLKLRHKVASLAREFLNNQKFIEIETPYLSKTTPEGARDFIVPSRMHQGKFYALAQAPQQYKQLLMIANFEKYYQFARAFRDEDMRADRQFEHTQIDIEMAYVDINDILNLVEQMFIHIAKSLGRKTFKEPFPRISYTDSMKKYKNDRFDLRKDKNDDTLAFAWVTDFPLLEYDEKAKRYTFSHNPFTAPKTEDIKKLSDKSKLKDISSFQFDLVLNGEELGSGSIRITDPKIQREVFKVMGLSSKEIDEDFGHLLEAYEYGAPPHGGIAIGFDRFCAVLAGEKNIREVIAFPVSGSGVSSVVDSPSKIDEVLLKELKIKSSK